MRLKKNLKNLKRDELSHSDPVSKCIVGLAVKKDLHLANKTVKINHQASMQ